MDTGLFGDGSIRLNWTGIEGLSGLQPRLFLVGELVAKGYGIGAVVQVGADVTAWEIACTYAFLGTATPQPYVLNWVKQRFGQLNPAPEDETHWDVRLPVPLSPTVIEGLEERRQGKDFSIQIDTTLLLLDGGEPKEPRTATYYGSHPTRTAQDERAEIVRYLKDARQKIDGADYEGSFACSRKALELLRGLSLAKSKTPIPKESKERDVPQRIHVVIDSLFSLASASLHTDGPIKDFEPMRADAVALAGATASVAQEVFART